MTMCLRGSHLLRAVLRARPMAHQAQTRQPQTDLQAKVTLPVAQKACLTQAVTRASHPAAVEVVNPHPHCVPQHQGLTRQTTTRSRSHPRMLILRCKQGNST